MLRVKKRQKIYKENLKIRVETVKKGVKFGHKI